jgi:capsular polysaccharide biosynthesis protein
VPPKTFSSSNRMMVLSGAKDGVGEVGHMAIDMQTRCLQKSKMQVITTSQLLSLTRRDWSFRVIIFKKSFAWMEN